MGRKADDRSAAPLCRAHHDQRHDLRGYFKGFDRDRMRAWKEWAVTTTRALLACEEAEGLF